MCKCPAHDDTHASLHVQEKDGAIVWHCHAGHSQDAVMNRLQDLGLWPWKGSVPRRQRETAPSKALPKKDTWPIATKLLRAAAESTEQPIEYLRKRGIHLVPKCAKLLPRKIVRELIGKNRPAMIVPSPKRTWDIALQMTAFGAKADFKVTGHTSAYDPQQTTSLAVVYPY